MIRVGAVQLAPRFGDVPGNLRRIRNLVRSGRADLWVLPELCATGYAFRSRAEAWSLAEPLGGRTEQELQRIATEGNAVLVAGFCERQGRRLFNSALVLGPKGRIGVYRKTHLFQEEKRIFRPGDSLPLFRTPVGPLGVLICYDWRFPEAARTLARKGALVLAHPANLVFPHAPDAMVTRALENRVFCVTAGRTGVERGLRFFGGSQAAAPSGKVLFRMSTEEEGVRVAAIDTAEAADKLLTPLNHLFRDRRPEIYLR